MSKLDNFKGKKHTFTPEEREKGGKKKTDKKLYSCQTNAIKNKSENTLKDCNSCGIPLCPYGEDDATCRLFNTKFVRLVMFQKNLSSVQEFDEYIFMFLVRGSKAKNSDSVKEILRFITELLEFQEWKHESLR